MHLSLSDLLTCPRCGPGYGLILLPAVARERRVESGVLGCPNCRERYVIEGGVADLRVPGVGEAVEAEGRPGEGVSVAGLDPDHPEGAVRLAALLGLAEASGPVALAGPAVAQAARLARLVEGIEVVALSSTATAAAGAMPVSRLTVGGLIPFRPGAFGAMALTGRWSERVLEGLQALRPAGRLLLDPATAAVRERLAGSGAEHVLDDEGTLVVARRP